MSGAFLQSKEWKAFQESMGRKVFQIDGVGQFIKMPLPFGKSYLYCPGKSVGHLVSDKLKKIAKKENAIFIRSGLFPPTTIILDLRKSEDELLKEMNQKTRYNIRLSERKGLKIVETRHGASLQDFWKLSEETGKRQKIKNFPKRYYEKLLEIKNFAYIATVYYKDKPLASGIFVDYKDTTTYFFGASSDEHKNLMAPYFLHWYKIKEAKKKGQKKYDFWGVDEKKWKGVTRFKKGFGGKIVTSSGFHDIPIQKGWYRLYQLVKLLKN